MVVVTIKDEGVASSVLYPKIIVFLNRKGSDKPALSYIHFIQATTKHFDWTRGIP